MTDRAILAFWNTVADCLVEFFDLNSDEAAATVSRLVARLSEFHDVSKPDRNLIYHSEPIHIASDLAGKEPSRDREFYDRYRRIQQRNLRLRKGHTFSMLEGKLPVAASAAEEGSKRLTVSRVSAKPIAQPRLLQAARMVNHQ